MLDAKPESFNALRLLSALPLLSALTLLYSSFNTPTSMEGWLLVVAAGLLGPGLGDVAYIEAIKLVGSGTAVTVGYTYILVSQALALLLLGEEVGWGLVAGSILALVGVWLVASSGPSGSANRRGITAAVVSSIAWGLGSIVNKLALLHVGPLSLALLRVLVLSPLMLLVGARGYRSMTSRRQVLAAVVTGSLSYGLGIPLFLYALDVVGVSVTVLTTALTPVLARLAAHAVAGEGLSVKGVAGTLLTALGVGVGVASQL